MYEVGTLTGRVFDRLPGAPIFSEMAEAEAWVMDFFRERALLRERNGAIEMLTIEIRPIIDPDSP